MKMIDKAECSVCKKVVYLYSKGMCQYCYWSSRKKQGKAVRKSRSTSRVRYVPTGEKEVFERIYIKQEGRCYVTGEKISDPRPWNFMHILSKAQNKYPQFKLYDRNIILVVRRFHELYDHGTLDQIYKEFDKWKNKVDEVYEIRSILIELYKMKHGR